MLTITSCPFPRLWLWQAAGRSSLGHTGSQQSFIGRVEVVPHIVADGLGVKLRVNRKTYSKRLTLSFDTLPPRVDPGALAAHVLEVMASCGDDQIVLDHISRLHDDVAPNWPSWEKIWAGSVL